MNEVEQILETGDAGEIIGGVIEGKPPKIDFAGVLLLAERNLLWGPDTQRLAEADISFDSWPLVWARQGQLPDLWWLMPKGLLLAYFKWCKQRGAATTGEQRRGRRQH